MQPAVFPPRNELRIVGADGVEVRREQNGLADFISRPQARDEIGAPGQHLLKFDFQSGPRGDARQKIRDALFTGSSASGLWPRRSRRSAGAKAGFTLGSAMSSASSFSVRVMRRKFNGRTLRCRESGRKAQRALSNIQITNTTCIQRPPLKLELHCQFNPVVHFGK